MAEDTVVLALEDSQNAAVNYVINYGMTHPAGELTLLPNAQPGS